MKIPIKDIMIGERQRIDLGDPLNDLASIGDAEVGLINPITIEQQTDGKYRLLAGRRRLEWHIRSGKTEIEATVKGQMTELARQKVELLEDIERKDRTWQEECLAFAKLFNLIRLEKVQRNETWTVRAMARFTGTDKTIIHYSIEIAKMLKAEPRDDEMWAAKNYTEALKLIVDRNYKLANDDLERRRQIWQQREAAARAVTEPVNQLSYSDLDVQITEESPSPDFINALPSAVQNEDITPPKTKIYIHGLNMAFEDAKPGVHFMEGMSRAGLVWRGKEKLQTNLMKALHQTGFFVIWNSNIPFAAEPQLIWNRISFGDDKTTFPFISNYVTGLLLYKDEPSIENPNPSGSVISCLPEGDELPYAVVDWCLRAIANGNQAVLCPVNAPILYVAMSGYTPVWFEADKTKFDAKVQQLKDYYLDNVPNCEVYLRKVDAEGDWTSELLP